MEVLTAEQIKVKYPNEWVLVGIDEKDAELRPFKGRVLLHGKDYLELCYKGSEIARNYLTATFFTGESTKKRKWLKSIRLYSKPSGLTAGNYM